MNNDWNINSLQNISCVQKLSRLELYLPGQELTMNEMLILFKIILLVYNAFIQVSFLLVKASLEESLHVTMVKLLDCGIKVNKFKLIRLLYSLSDSYLWKRYETPYLSSYGLNSITAVLLIIIIISCRQHGYPWPSLATSPYHSSPLAGLQGYIPYPHGAVLCMFKLVILLLLGHVLGSIGVHHSWARNPWRLICH